METRDFNQNAAPARYSYERNPVNEHFFRILRDNMPVGDYMLLDLSEDIALTEKKVMNVVTALNGRGTLLPLGEQTKSRQLFHLIHDGTNGEPIKVMFYTYKGEGCSRENALLTLERDNHVFH